MGVLKANVGGAWQAVGLAIPSAMVEQGTYTPALQVMAPGTGGSATNTADYMWVGGPSLGDKGLLSISGRLIFGTTGAVFPTTGGEQVGVPPGFNLISSPAVSAPIGFARPAAANSNFVGNLWYASTTMMRVVCVNPATAGWVDMTATVPGTWAAGNAIDWFLPGFPAVRA